MELRNHLYEQAGTGQDRYGLYRYDGRYDQHHDDIIDQYAPDSRASPYHSYFPLLSPNPYSNGQLPENFLSENHIAEAAGQSSGQPYNTVSDQVFGSQLRATKYSLKLLSSLLRERGLLHDRHIRDIQHRHMKLQEELCVARMMAGNLLDRNQVTLERLIAQLEDQKRDEELAFWKDRADVRKEMLKTALDYEEVRRRAILLSGMEVEYG